MKDVVRIDNAVPLMVLEYMRMRLQNEERWSFSYPKGAAFEKKHPKLTIYDGSDIPEAKLLEGMSHIILLSIYNSMVQQNMNLFHPSMLWCGASIKDKHREDNIHTDHEDDIPDDIRVVKLLGLLHGEWPEENGGHFEWGGKNHTMTPGTFLCFDPLVHHRATDILVNTKRIALDYTVRSTEPPTDRSRKT